MTEIEENKKPCILMRPSLAEEEEFSTASKYLPTYRKRSEIPSKSLVIGRYSTVPFYKELVEDLETNQSCLINSYRDHIWIADLREWYQDFEGITPKTWFSLQEIPEKGPFVLKGETNSRKFHWNTHMFAKDKKEAIEVYGRLSQDSLIGQQNIYIREYVPLVKLSEGLNGLPVSEEYRFFILDRKFISGAFYWSSHLDDLTVVPKADNVPEAFKQKVLDRLGSNARFVVVDIARKADGGWIVLEINDGQQSGPSENNLDELYSNMSKVLSFS